MRSPKLMGSNRTPHRRTNWLVATVLMIAATLLASPLAGVSVAAIPIGQTLASYGAPAQTETAGPDGATSFSAVLPNGRRITPAGSSVEVGENPLNSVLTPDSKYLIVTNNDERNTGAVDTRFSGDAANGAGKVPGGYVLSVIRTADMQVVTYTLPLKNPEPHTGPKTSGTSQSDQIAALFYGLAVRTAPGVPGSHIVYAAGGPSDVVYVYLLDATGVLKPTATISIPTPNDPNRPNQGMSAPAGLTLSEDSTRLYVVNNNANTVATIDTATNKVIGEPENVGFFPYAAAIVPGSNKLYVSNWGISDRHFNRQFQSTRDPKTGAGTGAPTIGGEPANLFANPITDPERSSSLSVLTINSRAKDPADRSISLARPIDGVQVVGGTHPSALAVVNRRGQKAVYVADANEDRIAIINPATDRLVKKITLPAPIKGYAPGYHLGLTPNALAVNSHNTRLYVAEAGLNSVAVYNVTSPFEPVFMGRIPTAWYPTALAVSPDSKTLYVTNAKGTGSPYRFQGAVKGSPDVNLLFGTVEKIELNSVNLRQTTAQVDANTYRRMPASNATVLPTLQREIKHTIFILRENKTYDTYLGSDAVLSGRGANGKPEYAAFAAQVPNTRALAERWGVGDNVFADSEESDAGHSFALAGTSTDYQQKTLLSRFARPFINTKNEDPEDYPLAGYIFNHLARQHRSYRNYGDMLRLSGYDEGKNANPCADDAYPGCDPRTYTYTNTLSPTVGLGGLYTEDVPALAALGNNHTDTRYPGWNLRISDQRRAREFIRDMSERIANNTVPEFTFIWLPNDHTGGGFDPRFEVADNDAGLGQIVDFISHSSMWPHSAIFITEDDAQGSPDHVDAHRTITQVISPFAKRGYVSHRHSSTVSIPKTILEIMGLPAMGWGDMVGNDLLDYFTTQADLTPYTALPAATISPPPPQAHRILALMSQLDNTTYDRDVSRLGQLTAAFLRSVELADSAAQLGDTAHDAAQADLYKIAEAIVDGDETTK
ncbi:MAG: hypothetical protein NVSMB42_06340 [Herpetosiphon sp.]